MLLSLLEVGTTNPVYILFKSVHTVRMQHVVQNAARREYVVDALLALVSQRELEDSEVGLQNYIEEALHERPYANSPVSWRTICQLPTWVV